MKTEQIVARPTMYNDVRFRSRLEARWAAFFDLIRWPWSYEPIDFKDWVPDFMVSFPCGHSECGPMHEFYAEVKPYRSIEEFKGHPAADWDAAYGCKYGLNGVILLGLDYTAAYTEFSHGHGGVYCEGINLFECWTLDQMKPDEIERAWSVAGNAVRWQPS